MKTIELLIQEDEDGGCSLCLHRRKKGEPAEKIQESECYKRYLDRGNLPPNEYGIEKCWELDTSQINRILPNTKLAEKILQTSYFV